MVSSIQEAAFSTVVVAILALGIEERRGCGSGDCGIAGECESSIISEDEDDSTEVAISEKDLSLSVYPVNEIEMTRI